MDLDIHASLLVFGSLRVRFGTPSNLHGKGKKEGTNTEDENPGKLAESAGAREERGMNESRSTAHDKYLVPFIKDNLHRQHRVFVYRTE